MTRIHRAVALVAAGCLGLGACTSPDTAETDVEGGQPTGEAVAPDDDPRRDALLTAVAGLTASVTTARDHLGRAGADGDADAALDAVAALTAAEELRDGAESEADPLLPGPETSRDESIDYGDTFSSAFAAARDAGGPLGGEVSRILTDTVAGDLGAWQRDAEGVLDAIDAAATGSIADAEPVILELAGEGTRALAWALFASRGDDADTVTAAAERGIAHLDLILLSLRELEPSPTPTPES